MCHEEQITSDDEHRCVCVCVCNLAVTVVERSWAQCYRTLWEQPPTDFVWTAVRYIDNRFVLYNHQHSHLEAFHVFSDLDFCGSPVELECVTDDSLLGFRVDVAQRRRIYIQPNSRQIRDLASAGPLRLRLSGLLSRSHLIRKYTYPRTAVNDSLHQLAELYVQKGYDAQTVLAMLRFI